jgi:hypothetical protein
MEKVHAVDGSWRLEGARTGQDLLASASASEDIRVGIRESQISATIVDSTRMPGLVVDS